MVITWTFFVTYSRLTWWAVSVFKPLSIAIIVAIGTVHRLLKKAFSRRITESVNPYRQLPETISKKRAGNIPETFSGFCNFGAWLRGFSGNYFQVNFMSTSFMSTHEKIFFPKTGHDSEAFPETFSNIWKHLWNIFSWVSTLEIYLEIVSGKSPGSRPNIAKSGKSREKVSGIFPGSRPKIAKSGKSREKVSGISPQSLPVFWK